MLTLSPTKAALQAATEATDALVRALRRARDHDWEIRAAGVVIEARHTGGALIRLSALTGDESRDLATETAWRSTLLAAAGAILARTPTSGLLYLSSTRIGRGHGVLEVQLIRPGSQAVVGTQQTLPPMASAPSTTGRRLLAPRGVA